MTKPDPRRLNRRYVFGSGSIMSRVLRILGKTLVAILAVALGFTAGWMLASRRSETRMDRVVAMAWGDGKYGQAFYGAQVSLEPAASGYTVRARVYIGRGNDYFYDCGSIGKAADDVEAVKKWGTIEFRPDGLHIGDYFLPRERMESHR